MRKFATIAAALAVLLAVALTVVFHESKADENPEKEALVYVYDRTEEGKLNISLHDDALQKLGSYVITMPLPVFEGLYKSGSSYYALFSADESTDSLVNFALMAYDEEFNLLSSAQISDPNLEIPAFPDTTDVLVTEEGILVSTFAKLTSIAVEESYYSDIVYFIDPETMTLKDSLYHVCEESYAGKIDTALYISDQHPAMAVTDQFNHQTICYSFDLSEDRIRVLSSDSFLLPDEGKMEELLKEIQDSHSIHFYDGELPEEEVTEKENSEVFTSDEENPEEEVSGEEPAESDEETSDESTSEEETSEVELTEEVTEETSDELTEETSDEMADETASEEE